MEGSTAAEVTGGDECLCEPPPFSIRVGVSRRHLQVKWRGSGASSTATYRCCGASSAATETTHHGRPHPIQRHPARRYGSSCRGKGVSREGVGDVPDHDVEGRRLGGDERGRRRRSRCRRRGGRSSTADRGHAR